MSDLTSAFESAVADSKSLTVRPDNSTLLKAYALYKQATVGDNTEKRPGFADFVECAKWDAWQELLPMPPHVAMQQYIDLIATLE